MNPDMLRCMIGVRDLPVWDMLYQGWWRMGLGCSATSLCLRRRHRPPRINDRHIHDSLIRQLLGNHEPTKRDSTTHYT